MRAPNPIHTAVPLDQAHRIPREIVVNHIAALLEVHSFRQNVGAQEQIEAILRIGGQGSGENRRETMQRLFSRDSAESGVRPGISNILRAGFRSSQTKVNSPGLTPVLSAPVP